MMCRRIVWNALTSSCRLSSSFALLRRSFVGSSSSHSTTTTTSVLWSSESKSLAETLRQSYVENESDGVLDFAISNNNKNNKNKNNRGGLETTLLPAPKVWDLVQQASQGKTGVAATMLNAWIGSYCLRSAEDTTAYDDTLELLDLWEQHAGANAGASVVVCQPDLVTYALAYTAVIRSCSSSSSSSSSPDSLFSAAVARGLLEKGRRFSKRAAGAKRRKALAAARRRSADTATNRIEDIRTLLNDDEFQVLEETDDYLVVSKPAGVVCNHKILTNAGKPKKKLKNNSAPGTKAAVSTDTSLVDALLSCNVPLSTLNPVSQGLVHRLDRGTSGCIFLAKTDEVHAQAVSEFFLRQTTKTYATIVAPASRISDGTIVVDLPVDGRPAKSSFRIMERFGSGTSSHDGTELSPAAALLEVTTFTGRKHQIRVHSACGLKAPVLNDSLHGTEDCVSRQELVVGVPEKYVLDEKERFFLHARSLTVPFLRAQVEAPLPRWWEPTLEALRNL